MDHATLDLPRGPRPPGREAVFRQIARAITGDIHRGRLKPGAALPGSRSLAGSLGVHRNTVLAAYRELASAGLVAVEGRTTRVARVQGPSPGPWSPAPGPALGFDLQAPPRPGPPPPPPTRALDFTAGLPDLRLVPADLLARALRRALTLRPRETLAYGAPAGDPRLREALGALLREIRGLDCGPGRILVTGGSQMALYLATRALVEPGDTVAVEDPGYPAAWRTFLAAGARIAPVPVDGGGLCIPAFEALLRRERIRALDPTPHHQFPTTATLDGPRRAALLDLARRHRVALLEDDYDFEFHFDGRPVLPLASADRAGVVVHLGSLSKVLAPGLRMGFIVAPEPLVAEMARHRQLVDHNGNRAAEWAVAELIEDGLLQRHVRKMRRVYADRRFLLAQFLERHLPAELAFRPAPGGLCFWARTAPGIQAGAWARRARSRGILVDPGCEFDFRERDTPFLRLAFSALDEAELQEAVLGLKAAL